MKRILSILSVATLFVLIGCTDSNDDMEIVYDSIIEPDFTVAAAEIVAGVTPVTFTNTTSVEGTTVAEYFWHFGFSGEGNWSEEAEPDPIVYNQAGEYTVTLTAWGADGNRATVKKVVTVLADNVVPTADFSYSPMMVNVGDEVTFTDKSTDSDGEIVSREWVFPDGSTSTETNPSYTFTQKGMFQVKLTVTDDRGGESSATKSINVRDGDVSDFTLLWSTEVASADALCDANVVTVSDLGYVYAVTGEGKLVALDAEGAVAWEYDAAAQDKVNLRKEIAYPSVDADGTVYWWRTPTATIRPSRPSMRSRVRRAPCSGRTRRPTPQAPASPSRRRASARTWSSSAAGARTARSADSRNRRDAIRPRPLRPTAAVRRARSSSKTAW